MKSEYGMLRAAALLTGACLLAGTTGGSRADERSTQAGTDRVAPMKQRLRTLMKRAPYRGVVPCGEGVLCAAEVDAIVLAAAATMSSDTMTVAVSDRVGNILALFREPGVLPTDAADAERAVGLARTAAFFSNNQAPLSSRTVRFISGIHFPPGIGNTPNAALYGIENTNRGCVRVPFGLGDFVPEARSPVGVSLDLPCNGLDRSGCGTGIVTGKPGPSDEPSSAVDPGGVPIFRPGPNGTAIVLGGIGVVGLPADQAEFTAFTAATAGGTLPVPVFPLPEPRNVFIDGVRLPFVNQVSRPSGTSTGASAGTYDPAFLPKDGKAAPEGDLVGPLDGTVLTSAQVRVIVDQAIAAARRTRANIRLPLGLCTRMVISVVDVDGTILALYRMPDATVFSIDVAVTKARNVVYFSGAGSADLPFVPPGTAVTNRTISFGAQPLFPPGIDSSPDSPGPFFGLFTQDLGLACTQGSQLQNANQSGIVFFPGSMPLYIGGQLVGGLGVSGDGVEQDDYVTFFGAAGFLPDESIWANTVFIPTSEGDVRLPFLKFPRSPESCTP
jgi:uncharacterized protein GlcG (DUF336 family)